MKKTLFLLIILLASCTDKYELEFEIDNTDTKFSTNETIVFESSHEVKNDSLLGLWMDNTVLEFDPQIEGSIRWVTKNKLEFHPNELYRPETKYKILLKKEALSLFNELKSVSDEEIELETSEFELIKVIGQWKIRENNVNKDILNLQLNFNREVNPVDVANNLELEIDGKKLESRLTTSSFSDEVVFELPLSDARKYKNKSIKIALKEGIQVNKVDWKTTKVLTSEYDIPSIDDLEVLDYKVGTSNGKSNIRLYLSQALDVNKFKKNQIEIDPKVDFEAEVTDYGILIKGDFEESTAYEVKLNENLESIYERTLGSEYVVDINFSQLEPSIDFTAKDMIYLSKNKSKNIGLSIVGLDSVKITITKIYENNLLSFFNRGKRSKYHYDGEGDWIDYYSYETDKYGDIVLEQTQSTKSLGSNGVVKVFNFRLDDKIDRQGLYVLTVASPSKYWVQSSQLVSLSDLGLIVKKSKNDLYVFANSLSQTESLDDVSISIISSKNQIEQIKKTNSSGIAIFKDYNRNGIVEVEPAIIIAKRGDDINYLPLDGKFQVNDYEFDTRGTSSADYKSFFYGDRNIYRPGETVVLSGIIRDKDWKNISNVPISAKIYTPLGNVYKNIKITLNDESGFDSKVSFPTTALTGTYWAEYYLSGDIYLGRYSFKVEEFMPDRLRIKLSSSKSEYFNTDSLHITAQVNNLYGTVAGNRNYELSFSTRRKHLSFDKYKDYDFNVEVKNEINFENLDKVITGKTDKQGEITYRTQLFDIYKNNGILTSRANLTVFDENGRPVNKSIEYDILTQKVFYGIGDFDYYNNVNSNVVIPILAIDKYQKIQKEKKLSVQIIRYNWNSVLVKNENGNYTYKSQKEEKLVEEKEFTHHDKNTKFSFKPTVPGRYEIRLRGVGEINYTAKQFYCFDWGGWQQSTAGDFEIDKEGKITIETEKESYNLNDKCKILFKTPFDGKMLVTLERDGIYYNKYLNTNNKSASLEIDLEEEHIPNVYISAILFKKVDNGALPLTVAYGYKSIEVIKKSNKIEMEIIATEKSKSNISQRIKIKTNMRDKNIHLTLAAVDEGILQVTNYKTPDPYNFFYKQYGLDVNSYTMYPYLYPELKLSDGQSGGDGAMEDIMVDGRVNPLSNKRVKLLSYWSGILKSDRNGIVETTLEIPQFSGAVRLMAVAYKGKSFGSVDKEMKVVDPIVINSSVPRFLSPDDELDLVVTLSNTEGKSTTASVKIKLDDMITAIGDTEKKLQLGANEEKQIVFKVKSAKRIGNSIIKILVDGHGSKFKQETDITIRPISSLQKSSGSGLLKSGKTLNLDLISNYIPITNKSKVVISKSPLISQLNNLNYLLQYPHGCVEQTVSKVFPQLYFKDLLSLTDDSPTKASISIANDNINSAISKLSSFQRYDGGLSYWQGSNTSNKWGSIYAAHFLTEAKNAGFNVNQSMLNKLYGFLQYKCLEKLKETDKFKNGDWVYVYDRNIFYSLYVLSLAGKADKSSMNMYKAELESLSEDSKFLLASAYKLAGDENSFTHIMPEKYYEKDIESKTGGTFASTVRNMAISLLSLIEADSDDYRVMSLSDKLIKIVDNKHFLSTQERAFSFLALGKLASKKTNNLASGSIIFNDKVFELGNEKYIVEHFKNANVTLKSTGSEDLYYFWESSGLTTDGSYKNENSKLKVERNYFDRNGNKLDDRFSQGDLVIVELKVSLLNKVDIVNNIAITDLLPAGFEIDNPRLSSNNTNYKWMKANTPEYIDFRDDRINMFTSLGGYEPTKKFYYICRAVTRGKFNKGVISADAMYDGSYRSYHGGGKIIIE